MQKEFAIGVEGELNSARYRSWIIQLEGADYRLVRSWNFRDNRYLHEIGASHCSKAEAADDHNCKPNDDDFQVHPCSRRYI